jgi:predicted nucleic acid binding AN1-type Zn finger protein
MRCSCNPSIALEKGNSHQHLLVCPKLSHLRTLRHTDIRNAIYTFAKASTSVSAVTLEPTLTSEIPGAPSIRPDLWVVKGSQNFYVDLAIVAPGAVTYLLKGSATQSGIPSKIMAESKRQKWSRSFPGSDNLKPFIPFILEASGRIGSSANNFIDKLSDFDQTLSVPNQITSSRRVVFKQRLCLLIAKWNARLMRSLRKNSSFLPAASTNITSQTHGSTTSPPQSHTRAESIFHNHTRAPRNFNAAWDHQCESAEGCPLLVEATCHSCQTMFCRQHYLDEEHRCAPDATAFLYPDQDPFDPSQDEDLAADLLGAGFGPTPEDEDTGTRRSQGVRTNADTDSRSARLTNQ